MRSVIKFMANSIQSELLTKCMYNDRNYPGIGYMWVIDVARKMDIEELVDKVNEHLVIKKMDVDDFKFINPQ